MLSPAFLGAITNGQSTFNLSKVFNVDLSLGTGVARDIITGLDFSDKGGLLWIKNRDASAQHLLEDTVRGSGNFIGTNSTATQGSSANTITSFNNDGFSVGTGAGVFNVSGQNDVFWQFLVEQGFFDIVETTGTGIAKTVPHNLNSDVGFITTKRLDTTGDWYSTHKDLSDEDLIVLNSTSDIVTSASSYPTLPTSLTFELGTNSNVNASGGSYIHYLWAHNPSKGIFCGSYTGTGAAGNKQTIGFPLGWLLIKNVTGGLGNWTIWDNTRDSLNPNTLELYPNNPNSESNVSNGINFLSDGFDFLAANGNNSGLDYIYIAIADPTQF